MGSWWRRSPGAALALVLLLLAVSMVLYLLRHERAAGLLAAAAAEVGALLRATVPTERIGLLAARGRVFDTVFLAGLGALILLGDLTDVYRVGAG